MTKHIFIFVLKKSNESVRRMVTFEDVCKGKTPKNTFIQNISTANSSYFFFFKFVYVIKKIYTINHKFLLCNLRGCKSVHFYTLYLVNSEDGFNFLDDVINQSSIVNRRHLFWLNLSGYLPNNTWQNSCCQTLITSKKHKTTHCQVIK